MREIEIETFLKAMGEGISRPVLVIGDDFNEYILKNQKVNENGILVDYNCMFVNELLAYQIADFLSIPIPESVIALVGEIYPETDPTLRFAYRFEEGKYFATEKLKYVEDNLKENYQELCKMGKPYMKRTWKNFFDKISNKEDFSRILAFDILISNFDRYRNTGNLLIDNTNLRKIYAIDHGHAFFGPMWIDDKIRCLNISSIGDNYIDEYTNAILNFLPGSVYNSLEENIDLNNLEINPFDEVVQKIKSITELDINKWMDNIPNEWYIDKGTQIIYYKNYILKQKEIVQDILQSLAYRGAFTNYKGGLLKWNNQKLNFHTV